MVVSGKLQEGVLWVRTNLAVPWSASELTCTECQKVPVQENLRCPTDHRLFQKSLLPLGRERMDTKRKGRKKAVLTLWVQQPDTSYTLQTQALTWEAHLKDGPWSPAPRHSDPISFQRGLSFSLCKLIPRVILMPAVQTRLGENYFVAKSKTSVSHKTQIFKTTMPVTIGRVDTSAPSLRHEEIAAVWSALLHKSRPRNADNVSNDQFPEADTRI